MERPQMRVSGPTLDAADPLALAGFYERLLGWPIVRQEGPGAGDPPTRGWAMLRSPFGDLKIEVQWEPNYRRPVWPSAPGEPLMMMHLDIGVADLEAGVAWARAQGAELADHQPQDDVRVLLDPAGHPFCLFADDRL
jgi:catechol 2,3-dioxygenase-like lactoylglutathione lyase family enzyme